MISIINKTINQVIYIETYIELLLYLSPTLNSWGKKIPIASYAVTEYSAGAGRLRIAPNHFNNLTQRVTKSLCCKLRTFLNQHSMIKFPGSFILFIIYLKCFYIYYSPGIYYITWNLLHPWPGRLLGLYPNNFVIPHYLFNSVIIIMGSSHPY